MRSMARSGSADGARRLPRAARRAAAAGLALSAVSAAPSRADAPAIFGRWLSEDRKAVVEMTPCGAELCGRVVWIGDKDAPATDVANPDAALRGRPICNLQILGGFKQAADAPAEWRDGWIYDPESGKTYHARMSLRDAATLDLRGYVGIPLFGETRVWTRDTASRPPCGAG